MPASRYSQSGSPAGPVMYFRSAPKPDPFGAHCEM